jgi:predicted PurR-regulated permease PerM
MMGFVISDNLGRDFTDILPLLVYVMVGYAIVQIIDNVVNQPLIFGKSVRSHPLEIFIVILIGGALFGILGLIAAVPTYTAIKVVSKEFLYEYKIVKHLTKNIETNTFGRNK